MLRIVYSRSAEANGLGRKKAFSRKKGKAEGKECLLKRIWGRVLRWLLMEPEPEPEPEPELEDRYARARRLGLREKTRQEMNAILEADYPTFDEFADAVLQYAEKNPEGFALLYPAKKRSPFTFSVE